MPGSRNGSACKRYADMAISLDTDFAADNIAISLAGKQTLTSQTSGGVGRGGVAVGPVGCRLTREVDETGVIFNHDHRGTRVHRGTWHGPQLKEGEK